MDNGHVENARLSLILFFVVWSMYLIVYMTKNCYSAAMAAIVSQGILTKTQTGTISAVFYLIYAPFQILGGIAADKFSPWKLVFIGLVGAGIANAIIFFNQNYTVMLITWSFNAVIQFGIWPAALRIICTQLAPAHRRRGMFYILTAGSAGLLVSYLCAALVTKWQYNFAVSALLLLAVAVAWLFFERYFRDRMAPDEMPQTVVKKPDAPKSGGFIRPFFTSGLILLSIFAVIRTLIDCGIKALTPIMIVEMYPGVSAALASALNTVLIIFGVLGLYLPRFIYPRRIRDEASAMTVFLILIIPLLALLLLIGKISVAVILVILALVALLSAGISPLQTSYIPIRFKKINKVATVSGIINCMASLGLVLANYVFAKIADDYGWLAAIKGWVVLAIIGIVMVGASIPLWRRFVKSDMA